MRRPGTVELPLLVTLAALLASRPAVAQVEPATPDRNLEIPLVEEMPRIEKSQLPASPAIAGVVARPPSLFVTVDPPSWSGLPAEDRTRLVVEVGKVALQLGYTGAVLQDPAGRSVAQWMQKTGVRLLDR